MKIVIAGLAKTGTTGLFYKLRNSTPGSPRTLFEARSYAPRPRDDERGVLAKILVGREGYADYASFDGFDKKICIIRDPRDRLISSLLYGAFAEDFVHDDDKLERYLETLRRKEQNSRSVSVTEIAALHEELSGRPVKVSAIAIRSFLDPLEWSMAFCRDRPDYHVVKYEDFVGERLEALSEYLGFPIGGDATVGVAVRRVVRTKGKGDWKNWFVPEDVAIMRNDARIVSYLSRFGYEDEWELSESPGIVPDHCSGYVARLAAERRGKKPRSGPVAAPGAPTTTDAGEA